MDSFGTWQKWKLIFFGVNAEFYRVIWTINVLLTVRSEMLPFSGNNQNIIFFLESPPPPPPEHFAIGYVHNDNLPLGNIALPYVIPNNCRKVWWCLLMISCTFWRSRKKLSNSPKLYFVHKIENFKTFAQTFDSYVPHIFNMKKPKVLINTSCFHTFSHKGC